MRSAEWRQVREFATAVRSASAALALRGEAGAGKSTLWRGGVAAAQQPATGFCLPSRRPVRPTCPSRGCPTCWPACSGRWPPASRRRSWRRWRWRCCCGAGPQPPAAHAVGLAVLAALRACASRGPVLVAVDDVQWLDEASRDALAFAFRRISDGALALLIAARTAGSADPLTAGEPPPPTGWQALLMTGPVMEVIDLAPLDMWQIQNLLPDTVPDARARRLPARLMRRRRPLMPGPATRRRRSSPCRRSRSPTDRTPAS